MDKNGKVKTGIREKLIEQNKKSMNKESIKQLKHTDYSNVSKDSVSKTAKNDLVPIIIGQVLYYTVPPTIFEIKTIIKNKNTDLDSFFRKMASASKRIIKYAISKLKNMFSNIFSDSMKALVRNFFDILISLIKTTVKRLVSVIKKVVLCLINCAKTIVSKDATAPQKADAVFTSLSITVAAVVLEIITEWAEKQFGIPDILMEPLQIVATIFTTNIIMLVLQKVDLFNVRYGFIVSNMEKIFEEEMTRYKNESNSLSDITDKEIKVKMEELNNEISEIEKNIQSFDINKDDIEIEIERINKVFSMDINLKTEWQEFAFN